MEKKHKKKRRIRFSFIGGRRPALFDHFGEKNKESEINNDAPLIAEEQSTTHTIVINDIDNETKVSNDDPQQSKEIQQLQKTTREKEGNTNKEGKRDIKTPDRLNNFIIDENLSELKKNSINEMREKVEKSTDRHKKQMTQISEEMKDELEKWNELTSYKVFDFEVQDDEVDPKPFHVYDLSQENQNLIENCMKLQIKDLEIKQLHQELKLKQKNVEAILEKTLRQQVMDKTLNNTIPETPRHLITKIISLDK